MKQSDGILCTMHDGIRTKKIWKNRKRRGVESKKWVTITSEATVSNKPRKMMRQLRTIYIYTPSWNRELCFVKNFAWSSNNLTDDNNNEKYKNLFWWLESVSMAKCWDQK